MIESKYTASIHKLIDKQVYRWKINDSFQGGVADAYYSGTNGDMWIEYKYLKSLPKRASTQIIPDLRPLQKKWLNERHIEGRSVHVAIGSPDGVSLLLPSEWETGISCEEFKDRALSRDAFAKWIEAQCLKKETK